MINVLLVEDNTSQVEMMRRWLESPPGKFSVMPAGTVAEARAEIARGGYDVMMLDLQLPDGDGRELLNDTIRCDPRLPVIVVSGKDDEKTIGELYAAGVDLFVCKGCINSALGWQSQIALVVDRRAAYRAVFEAATRPRGGSANEIAATANA